MKNKLNYKIKFYKTYDCYCSDPVHDCRKPVIFNTYFETVLKNKNGNKIYLTANTFLELAKKALPQLKKGWVTA